MRERFAADPTSNPFYGRTPTNYEGWGCGGYVPELGYSVRSSWERDYLIALQSAGIKFEYEPHRVDLGDGMTYLPDVLIDDTNFYVEITGWDKPIKQEKRRRFVEIYDVRLHVVYERPTDDSIADLIAVCEEVVP